MYVTVHCVRPYKMCLHWCTLLYTVCSLVNVFTLIYVTVYCYCIHIVICYYILKKKLHWCMLLCTLYSLMKNVHTEVRYCTLCATIWKVLTLMYVTVHCVQPREKCSHWYTLRYTVLSFENVFTLMYVTVQCLLLCKRSIHWCTLLHTVFRLVKSIYTHVRYCTLCTGL